MFQRDKPQWPGVKKAIAFHGVCPEWGRSAWRLRGCWRWTWGTGSFLSAHTDFVITPQLILLPPLRAATTQTLASANSPHITLWLVNAQLGSHYIWFICFSAGHQDSHRILKFCQMWKSHRGYHIRLADFLSYNLPWKIVFLKDTDRVCIMSETTFYLCACFGCNVTPRLCLLLYLFSVIYKMWCHSPFKDDKLHKIVSRWDKESKLCSPLFISNLYTSINDDR